jgi:hypothetical protein
MLSLQPSDPSTATCLDCTLRQFFSALRSTVVHRTLEPTKFSTVKAIEIRRHKTEVRNHRRVYGKSDRCPSNDALL